MNTDSIQSKDAKAQTLTRLELLGKGRKEFAKGKGPSGPSERVRASPFR
jgi:hypothetical protein